MGISNITDDGRLDLSDIRHVSEDDYPRWTRRVTPRAGDVVFTYEATLHRYALVPDDLRACLGRRVALVRPKPDLADSRFLLYYFLSRPWRQVVEGHVITGATVDRIPLEKFPEFPAALPDVDVQRRIADILSAYDDLIENNRRRMVLLEEAARQLYREWFVRLRFPGHEHTHIVDGVPEGWERLTLGECAKLLSGGTPSKARPEFWEGEIPWVSSGELTSMRVRRTALCISEDGAEQGSRVVPPNTILAVVRGMSLAKEFRIGLSARSVAFNQDIKAIVPEASVHPVVLFHCLHAQREQIRDRSGEAAHGTKKLDSAVLEAVPILVPPKRLQDEFVDLAGSVHALWDNLDQQVEQLRATRDLLLPRLMSGELSV